MGEFVFVGEYLLKERKIRSMYACVCSERKLVASLVDELLEKIKKEYVVSFHKVMYENNLIVVVVDKE